MKLTRLRWGYFRIAVAAVMVLTQPIPMLAIGEDSLFDRVDSNVLKKGVHQHRNGPSSSFHWSRNCPLPSILGYFNNDHDESVVQPEAACCCSITDFGVSSYGFGVFCVLLLSVLAIRNYQLNMWRTHTYYRQ